MRPINLVFILFILFLAFCCQKREKGSNQKEPPHTEQVPDTVQAKLNYDPSSLPESPFRIPTILVKNNKHMRFTNNTDYNAEFIIPNADKLFNDIAYDDTLRINNVLYMFFSISANDKSKLLHIHPSANPDSMGAKIYPFSAFCNDGTEAAERNSSPIIIVEP